MRKLFTAFALLLVCVAKVVAQHPVQVTPQLIPPYTLQVSEYYSPTVAGAEKLRLMLLNRDLQRPQLVVRLRMIIEGQSLRIRTREDVVFAPVTLISGTPYYVTPSELAQYFNPDNLEFSGLSRQQYETTGKLPEGFYSFCIEAVEVQTGQVVSNRGCAFAWMTLNEPPFLNLPSKNEIVTPRNPQNIIFNWTPRHTSSPTAAFNIDYVFSIIEIVDNGLAPEAAFTTGTPLWKDSTATTTYLYDVTKPALIPGKKYAWRVQAKAKSGTEDLAMFRNQGYSETWWFTYQNTCAAPIGISATPQGQNVTIQWQQNIQHLEYKLEYREKNNPDAVWFTATNTIPRVMLTDLKPSKLYEYRVGGACEVGVLNFSDLLTFTTNAATVNNLPYCGDSSLIPGSVPQNPLLTMPDTIKAGDFKVVVTQVSGGSGIFSGKGYVMIPWLANVKVEVQFSSVGVNTEKKLASGTIQTMYDPNEGGIGDIDELLDVYIAGQGVGGVKSGLDTTDYKIGFTIPMPGGITTSFGPGYNPATGQGPVTITVTPLGGGPAVTLTSDHLPATIKDAGGNIYQVNTDGTVTAIGKAGGQQLLATVNKKNIDSEKALVKFVNYPGKQIYAFDEWNTIYKKSGSFNKEYERLNDDYYVSAKSIIPGKTDYLKAVVTITDTTIKADSIQFVNGKGTIYNKTKLSTGVYEIAVVGGPERDAQEIYALYSKPGSKTLNFGKVLVASYPPKEFKIKLVPVNGVSFTAQHAQNVKDTLNKIYGKLNVRFDVTLATNFSNLTWDTDGDGLDVKGSNALTSLTKEMKNLVNVYRKNVPIESDVFYIFVLDHAADSTVMGDMPRGQKFGFLFTQGNATKERTVAHEVAHGIFKLKHIFDDYGFSASDLPDNALTYPAGGSFSKYQWDLIHDPAFVFGFFDSDDDGALTKVNAGEIPFKNPGTETFSFYDPTGRIKTLPTNIKAVYFSTGDMYVRSGTTYVVDPNDVAMVGSLVAFTDAQDSVWTHRMSQRGTTVSVGYANEVSNSVFKEAPEYANIVKRPIIGRPCFTDGKFRFQILDVPDTTTINITNRGSFQSVDAISNYFVSNNARSVLINSRMIDMHPAAEQYILRNISSASPDKPYATYIFALADFIKEFPEVHELCNFATDEGFEELKKHIDTAVSDQTERNKLLLDYYKGYLDMYLEYHNSHRARVLSMIRNGCSLPENDPLHWMVNQPTCVSVRIRALGELKCLMYGMEWQTERKMLLDMIMEFLQVATVLDQRDAVSRAFADICANTPPAQYDQLLSYFEAQNFKKLFQAYNWLTTDDSKEIFVNIITAILNHKYKSQKAAAEALKAEPVVFTQPQSLTTINIPIWNTTVLEDCGSILSGPVCKSMYGEVDANGVLTFKFTTKFSSVPLEEWKYSGNPYTTWINIYVKENFNYADLKAGQVITVPLFYAFHMAKHHRAFLHSQAKRIAINTVAILGAAFTGGTSLTLVVLDVAVSVTDIVVTINEDRLMNTEFYRIWNNIQLLVGGVQIIAGSGLKFSMPENTLAFSKYKQLRTYIGNLLTEAAAKGSAFIEPVRLAALKMAFEIQLLKYQIKHHWVSLFPNSKLFNDFNSLSLRVPNVSSEIRIAELRYLNNEPYYFFEGTQAHWVEDVMEADALVAGGKLRKVGQLDNASYYLAADKKGEATLEFFQDVELPSKIYVVRRVVNTVGGSSDAFILRLDNILAHPNFDQVLNRLRQLPESARRTADYASTVSFRDKFLSLHAGNTGVKSMDEVLDDFHSLILNHSNLDGVHLYIDEMMQSATKFKGGAFGMEIITGILPAKLNGKTLTGFEALISDISDCRFDLKFGDQSMTIFVEAKNYAHNTALGSSFLNQFKSYLGRIGSTDELLYVFRRNEQVTDALVKTKFEKLISNNVNDVFNAMSQELRAELNITSAASLTSTKIQEIVGKIVDLK